MRQGRGRGVGHECFGGRDIAFGFNRNSTGEHGDTGVKINTPIALLKP